MKFSSIYFLCTGNSCRSQMAEGFAKKYLGYECEIYSAGIEAKGIHPFSIQVMSEKGIDISNQTSDVVTIQLLNKADVVITLCKDAKERCPVILPRASHYHWAFDDPAKAQGTESEILDEFRRVRDEIEATMQKFAQGDAGVAFYINENKQQELKKREDFGQRIQLIREQKGWSLKELSVQLQVSEDYLSRTEKSTTEPSKFFIHRLASALQIEHDNLIDHLYIVKGDDITKIVN